MVYIPNNNVEVLLHILHFLREVLEVIILKNTQKTKILSSFTSRNIDLRFGAKLN